MTAFELHSLHDALALFFWLARSRHCTACIAFRLRMAAHALLSGCVVNTAYKPFHVSGMHRNSQSKDASSIKVNPFETCPTAINENPWLINQPLAIFLCGVLFFGEEPLDNPNHFVANSLPLDPRTFAGETIAPPCEPKIVSSSSAASSDKA